MEIALKIGLKFDPRSNRTISGRFSYFFILCSVMNNEYSVSVIISIHYVNVSRLWRELEIWKNESAVIAVHTHASFVMLSSQFSIQIFKLASLAGPVHIRFCNQIPKPYQPVDDFFITIITIDFGYLYHE